MIPGPLPDHVVKRFVKRCLDEREAMGLPRHIEDEAVLARIASIVRQYVTDDGRAAG